MEQLMERYRYVVQEWAKYRIDIALMMKLPEEQRPERADQIGDRIESLLDGYDVTIAHMKALFGGDFETIHFVEIVRQVEASYALIAKEALNPARTCFKDWLLPIAVALPSMDVQPLVERMDKLDLRQWCEAGDRASTIEGSFRFNSFSAKAQSVFGTVWTDAQTSLSSQAALFCDAAGAREEMKLIRERRYLKMGIASARGAITEWLLLHVATQRGEQRSTWFIDGLGLTDILSPFAPALSIDPQ